MKKELRHYKQREYELEKRRENCDTEIQVEEVEDELKEVKEIIDKIVL